MTHAGYRQEEALNRIIQGDSPVADFSLQPQTTVVQGRALDHTMRPVPGALVSAHNSRGEIVAYTTTGYDGSYRFSALLPGSYALRAMAYGFAPGEAAGLALGSGQTIDRDLTLIPAAISTQSRLADLLRAAGLGGATIHGGPGSSWFYTLIDYLMAHNPEPQRIQGDQYCHRSVPAAEYVEAQDEQDHAFSTKTAQGFLLRGLGSGARDWQYQHLDQRRRLCPAGFPVLGGPGLVGPPRNRRGRVRCTVWQTFLHDLPTWADLAAGFCETLKNFPWDFSSGPATLEGTLSSFFGMINNSVTVWNLFNELKQIQMGRLRHDRGLRGSVSR